MMKRLNPTWAKRQQELISEKLANNEVYETIESFSLAKTFLVKELAKRNIPFRAYSLGAGVTKITTDTTTCPCCKRKL